MTTVTYLFGRRDTTLDELQAEFPDYEIVRELDKGRGFVFIAVRERGDGPTLVMTDSADELREILGGGLVTP